jgi:hypothetical protein
MWKLTQGYIGTDLLASMKPTATSTHHERWMMSGWKTFSH